MATRNYQSIGEVLVAVKTEFPDITISKIRFLEAEGLIEPERTPSGYRKFYAQDLDKLKSILRMQRDEYLPLKVIKERRRTDRSADVVGGDVGRHRHREGTDQGPRVLRHRVLARARVGHLLRRRRLHRALDREGLLPVRRRASAPDHVQTLRGRSRASSSRRCCGRTSATTSRAPEVASPRLRATAVVVALLAVPLAFGAASARPGGTPPPTPVPPSSFLWWSPA